MDNEETGEKGFYFKDLKPKEFEDNEFYFDEKKELKQRKTANSEPLILIRISDKITEEQFASLLTELQDKLNQKPEFDEFLSNNNYFGNLSLWQANNNKESDKAPAGGRRDKKSFGKASRRLQKIS